ncbi:MAG: SWIM zinc finger family protein [Acidobacteriota bacterium]|jgi:hypothetical protein
MARRQRLRLQPRTPLGLLWADWINGYAVGHERLAKSLDYAEGGAVSDLRIDGSTVEAIVRGNSPQPYQVIWQFSPIDKQRWKLFWSAMSPEAIREYRKGAPGLATEAALAAADIHLLPERYKHLRPACTCPDWIRPCKHALAVLRILGLAVEEDPMLLLSLRDGIEREGETPPEPQTAGRPGEALDAGRFWKGSIDWEPWRAAMLTAGSPARLLKRLGPVSVYGIKMDPDAIFKPVYEGVASEARQVVESILRKDKKP